MSDTGKNEEARLAAKPRSVEEALAHKGDHPDFDAFVATICALRMPDGCPWDKEQTHQSIAHNMIEEAYEAVDAIEKSDMAHLREELGDVLLQVVLQSQIASDEGAFTIDDVCADVNAKMIRRHPHVFGSESAANSADVKELWEQVKAQEAASAASENGGKQQGSSAAAPSDGPQADQTASAVPQGLLDTVPSGFPALMQAQKVSKKAAKAGFEWDTIDDIWEKVAEEVEELKAAYLAAPKTDSGKVLPDENPAAAAAVELEFGDVLFSLVNVARRMGVNAEGALRATCVKFRERWAFIEGAAAGMGRPVDTLSAEELNQLWEMAKRLG